MASHLTVTTTQAGVTSTKGFGPQADTGGGDALGAFAALLGAANQSATATSSSETSTELNLGNLVNLSFGAGFGGDEGGQTEDPEAIAAVIDATLPIQTAVDPKQLMTDLVDSLADLKLKLEAGEAVDPELLKRIDASLNDLAAQFDIELAALPSLDDLKALVTSILPDDTSAEAQLTKALAPLAENLLAGTASSDGELSAAMKSIGEKLTALLQQMNSEDISPEQLAKLGLNIDGPLESDLQAAIAKLAAAAAKVDASANAVVLATPQLKLTEPVLTGKSAAGIDAEIAAAAAPVPTETPEALKPGSPSTGENSSKPVDGKTDDTHKPIEAKVSASISVAAPKDAPTDPQVAVQPTQVASRIDASMARPVVQPGYQTSQQQLNLPQLAFELVRQVNDGNTRFQMRLDPPELGKIDVKLDIGPSGQINARLTVERAETLDLMQRDQRGLEKALQQAGLDGAKTNLEVSLKQNPFSGGQQQGQDGNGRQPLFGGDLSAEVEDTPPPTINLYRGSLTASGVNIIA